VASIVDGVDFVLRNTAELLQKLPVYFPSVQTHVEDGLIITLAGSDASPYNGVLVLDQDSVTDQRLSEIEVLYRQANLHFGIEVCNHHKIPLCDSILCENGYVQTVRDAIMSLTGSMPVSTLNPHVNICPIITQSDREQYRHVLTTAFGMPPGVAPEFFDAMLNITESHQMIALLDGKPVGSGMLLCLHDTATIYNVATLPDAQHQGVGTAMMAVLHERALAEGYSGTALTVQSQEGFSLYQHLGYSHDGYRCIYELI
jgi:GNAT superfamily N-acetyltransferase